MEYVKTVHVSFAALTIISFTLRGILMLAESPLLQSKPSRIIPHIIDAVLLFSGITLLINYTGHFYGYGWLVAKLTAIVLYIVTGAIALKYGKTVTVRITALLVSWCLLALIVWLALTRSISPGF